jgi:hypothetical protein
LSSNGPEFSELFQLFDIELPLPQFQLIHAEQVPSPYHQMLVHPHHMTVTVEDFYGGPVSVRVLQRIKENDTYARKIVLEHPRAGIVLYGIVRIHLHYTNDAVRDAILTEQTPLGRILIEHDVLRRIEPTAFLRFEPTMTFAKNYATSTVTFGRLGIIHCDHRPAIELLEILAPISPPYSG